MRETLDDVERHQGPVLNAISSTNGTTRLLRRELESLRELAADQTQAIERLTETTAQATRLTDLETAVTDHATTQRWLIDRVETIRSEMLFELRYGRATGDPDDHQPDIEVVNPAALSVDGGDIRLNLGCGHIHLDGYANVDMRRLPGVDVVAPVDAVPVAPGTVAEIFSAHVLEHFPEEQLSRTLLPYWRSLLRPGGVFRAVVT